VPLPVVLLSFSIANVIAGWRPTSFARSPPTLWAMAKPALTEAIQDYLREIYKLGTDGGRVSVTALAKRLGVSPASASAMVKKLAALELAVHQPYRGVTLTAAGERVALEVIRHHRLLELYLAETLGLDVADVHDEAERLEHALSEELEARIDRVLGFPTHDPHGDPIPNSNLQWPKNRSAATAAPSHRAKRGSTS
jgi:DtxR family transcriptional regulator, Mn-dependent transcriptional regulator